MAAGLTLTGTTGSDILTGGSGDDLFQPGAGADTILGNGGTDIVVLSFQPTASQYFVAGQTTVFDGPDGRDVVDNVFLYSYNGVARTLAAWNSGSLSQTGTAGDDLLSLGAINNFGSSDGGAGNDAVILAPTPATATLVNIETVTGSSLGDYIAMTNALSGALINLSGGNDYLVLSGSAVSTSISGVETLVGSSTSDQLSVGDALSGAVINLLGGSDALSLAGGGNTLTTYFVESLLGGGGNDYITFARATAGATIDGGAGIDDIRLSGGASTATINNVETLVGSGAADLFSLAGPVNGLLVNTLGGADRLLLADGGNALTAYWLESLTGGSGDDSVTFGRAVSGGSFDLGAGNDYLRTGDFGNVMTVANAETLASGSAADYIVLTTPVSGALINTLGGLDRLQLADGGNSLTALRVETITGGNGNDVVSIGKPLVSGSIDLGAGTDAVSLASDAMNRVVFTNVESIIGNSPNDQISVILTGNQVFINSEIDILGYQGFGSLTVNGSNRVRYTDPYLNTNSWTVTSDLYLRNSSHIQLDIINHPDRIHIENVSKITYNISTPYSLRGAPFNVGPTFDGLTNTEVTIQFMGQAGGFLRSHQGSLEPLTLTTQTATTGTANFIDYDVIFLTTPVASGQLANDTNLSAFCAALGQVTVDATNIMNTRAMVFANDGTSTAIYSVQDLRSIGIMPGDDEVVLLGVFEGKILTAANLSLLIY